ARTVASSVCGLISHWTNVTTTIMAAAATIPTPSTRPITGRAPGSDAMLFSAIKLTSEQSHPEYERDENAKTRIDQRWRPYIRIETSAFKQPASEQSRPNPNQCAEHPRRKERTDDINLWSHRAPFVVPGSAPSTLLRTWFRIPGWGEDVEPGTLNFEPLIMVLVLRS